MQKVMSYINMKILIQNRQKAKGSAEHLQNKIEDMLKNNNILEGK